MRKSEIGGKLMRLIVIVFGVSGAGKTTVANCSPNNGWRFYEADDFHPRASIEKMRSGRPLTARQMAVAGTFARAITRSIAAKDNAVLACSALKRAYRDRCVSDDVTFVFLRGIKASAEQLRHRRGHFMNPGY